MSIPDYQSIMLPLLILADDGADHRLSDATNVLADEFELAPEERLVLLPSGRQAAFSNRVGWARTYLTKAGLLCSPQRGHFQITSRGKEVLTQGPSRIDVRFLRQFPELLEFIGQRPGDAARTDDAFSVNVEQTPEDVLERSVQALEHALAREVLEKVREIDPLSFEKLVLKLLQAMGYGDFRPDAAHHTGRSGDLGIDGLINEDELGFRCRLRAGEEMGGASRRLGGEELCRKPRRQARHQGSADHDIDVQP